MRDGTESTLFAGLLESAPDAMVIVNEAGNIVLVNAQTEKLFGYRRDELLGKTVDMLVPQRFHPRHAGHRSEYTRDPRVRPMGAGLDLFGRRKDDTEFPVEISLSPIKTDQGTLIASAIRDITDRKHIEQALREKNLQLEDANLAKDRFLAGMSHELRTPLNAIIGFSGTLLLGLPGPLNEEQTKQLEIIRNGANHLLLLINDILDLAKIESGKIELQFEAVDVASVVNEVAAALRSMAEKKGLSLEITVPDGEVIIATDQRALRQILINLANNAVKYTEQGAVRVALTTDPRVREIEIAVIDSGAGIREEDQKRLFQAFEQLDVSSTRRHEGAGLGLYLSHKLATLLDGRIDFSSTFGKGSTFTLRLPATR